MNPKKNLLFILSPGLGNIHRGFEESASQLFDIIFKIKKWDTFLFCAKRVKQTNNISLFFFYRNSIMANILSRLSKRLYPEFVEEISFSISLLPFLFNKRLALVYTAELRLANILYKFRKLFKFSYKIVFANGAPYGPEYYANKFDAVQQKVKWVYEEAIEYGIPEKLQYIVPNGLNLITNNSLTEPERVAKRNVFGYSEYDKIILSVGAINAFHKRVDYIINEFCVLLEKTNAYLILLGQLDKNSEKILSKFSNLRVGEKPYLKVANVLPNEVNNYYEIADCYVQASLYEGFGRSIIESISYGLPAIIHNSKGFRELTGNTVDYINMELPGSLSKKLDEFFLQDIYAKDTGKARQYVLSKYDWTNVSTNYEKMFEEVQM